MHTSRPPRGGSSPAALPALLRASHLLGLALGSALGRLRESGATAARLFGRAEESTLLLRMTREAAAILGARWDKVPERHRPHYVPEQRFRILRIRSFFGLSQRETGEMFRVSTETIARWELEATGVDREVARPLVAPDPPVRRFADAGGDLLRTDTRASLCDPAPARQAAEGTMDSPFRLEYLDAERMLPVLVRKAA